MADTTKEEQQRAELHKAIWAAADRLRSSVDGWDLRQYVLGMPFYRFVSENLAAHLDALVHASGDASFSYAGFDGEGAETAREDTVASMGRSSETRERLGLLALMPYYDNTGVGYEAKRELILEK